MTTQRRLAHEHRPHQVYALRAADGTILYIGCTSNFPERLKSHLSMQPWAAEIDPTRTVLSDEMSWEDALAAEEAAIEKYAPRHNVRRTNGSRAVELGVRDLLATERRLKRAAATGDPQAVADLEAWQDEQERVALDQMRHIGLPA